AVEREDQRWPAHDRLELERVERRAVSVDDLDAQAIAPRRPERNLALLGASERLHAEDVGATEQDVLDPRPFVPHLDRAVEIPRRRPETEDVRHQTARPGELEDRAAVGVLSRDLREVDRRLIARREDVRAFEEEPRLEVKVLVA